LNNSYPNLNPWLDETKPYKAGLTFEQVSEIYKIPIKNILRLAGNESTIGISPNALKATQEASKNSNFYDEPKSEKLTEALKESFTAEGIDMTNLGFVCGNGMDSVIEHVLTLFAKDGDSIIDLYPTFIYYNFAAKRLNLEIIEVAREFTENNLELSYKVNISKVINSLKDNTRVVFLCSPNNPDGGITDLKEIEELAKVLQEKNIILFVDHAYIEFADRKIFDARSIIEKYPNMIIGYTFSKAHGLAGLRVGYGLMHKNLQEKFLSLLTPFLITRPSIAAAIASLKDTKHLQKVIENNTQEKIKLEKIFNELKLKVFKSESNFLLVKNTHDLYQKLLSKGIIVRPFDNLESVRITIGQAKEIERLVKAIKESIKH